MKIQNGFSLKPLSPEERAAAQDQQLRAAAKMYENHFLNEMVKAMRKTVTRDENSPLKQNFAEKIFTEQLDQKYVDGWSEKGGVGLADMIYKQIKEQYFNNTKRDFSHPRGALPLKSGADSVQMKMIPGGRTSALEYRFEVPDPSGEPVDVLAPFDGHIVSAAPLSDGWQSVKLDHGLGVTSELTFPGLMAAKVSQVPVKAGQKLGLIDPGRPVLAWNLDGLNNITPG